MGRRWQPSKWVRHACSIIETYALAALTGWAVAYWFAEQYVGSAWIRVIALCGAIAAVDAQRRWRHLRRERAISRRSRLACPRCGYDLKFNKGRCPECGAPAIASTGRFAEVRPAVSDEIK